MCAWQRASGVRNQNDRYKFGKRICLRSSFVDNYCNPYESAYLKPAWSKRENKSWADDEVTKHLLQNMIKSVLNCLPAFYSSILIVSFHDVSLIMCSQWRLHFFSWKTDSCRANCSMRGTCNWSHVSPVFYFKTTTATKKKLRCNIPLKYHEIRQPIPLYRKVVKVHCSSPDTKQTALTHAKLFLNFSQPSLFLLFLCAAVEDIKGPTTT